MKDITLFTEAEKRTIEECFGVPFEYFVLQQQVLERTAEFYRLTIELRQLREEQQYCRE
jgi:hypothetical protein